MTKMEEIKEMIVRKADNLGIAFVHRHPFVCPFYNIKTHHCSEEDGDVLCMLELEEEFDWDKIAGRLKIHKGEKA